MLVTKPTIIQAELAWCNNTHKYINNGKFADIKNLTSVILENEQSHSRPNPANPSLSITTYLPGVGQVVVDGKQWLFLFGKCNVDQYQFLINHKDPAIQVNLKHKKWKLLK